MKAHAGEQIRGARNAWRRGERRRLKRASSKRRRRAARVLFGDAPRRLRVRGWSD